LIPSIGNNYTSRNTGAQVQKEGHGNMNDLSGAYRTLSEVAWPEQAGSKWRRAIVLAVVGSLLLALSARIQVPFYPVPMTMQPLVVVLIGAALGMRLGAATLVLYYTQGLMGLPVFAGTPEKGLGLAYMAGPTGGYLAGFILAAALAGFLAEKGWGRKALSTFAMMVLATAVIYIPGVLWLGALVGWDKPVLEMGLYPFLAGDVVKAALATAVLPMVWQFLKKIR
jgi:biotin transport system substrate-specific component